MTADNPVTVAPNADGEAERRYFWLSILGDICSTWPDPLTVRGAVGAEFRRPGRPFIWANGSEAERLIGFATADEAQRWREILSGCSLAVQEEEFAALVPKLRSGKEAVELVRSHGWWRRLLVTSSGRLVTGDVVALCRAPVGGLTAEGKAAWERAQT